MTSNPSLTRFQSLLSEVRTDCFDRALAIPSHKRERAWLQRLHSEPSSSTEAPLGWVRSKDFPVEPPAYKSEKSVFYWLHRALTPTVLTLEIPSQSKGVFELPPLSSAWEFYRIRVGAGAEVTLRDDQALAEVGERTPFRGVLVEVGEAARVRWQGFQHHAKALTVFDHKRFIVGSSAQVDYTHHVLGGLYAWDEALFELVGDHSTVSSQSLFFGHKMQQQELRVNHLHVGRQTKSHMISKGAVNDQAHASFLGMIQMERGCDGADGYLEEHNLLLSSGSKIDAVPGLEIGHHDVKAGHAAYMERVDEEKLFYAAARGIPAQEAMELIVEGFFLDALQKLDDEALQTRIFQSILEGLHPRHAALSV